MHRKTLLPEVVSEVIHLDLYNLLFSVRNLLLQYGRTALGGQKFYWLYDSLFCKELRTYQSDHVLLLAPEGICVGILYGYVLKSRNEVDDSTCERSAFSQGTSKVDLLFSIS